MPDWLGARAAERPDHPALIAGPVRMTFRDLDRCAARAARRLASLGVSGETRVALALRGGASTVVLAHALARVGAIMVPLNTRLTAPELAWQLADAGAAIVISDPALAPLVDEAAGADPGVVRLVADGTGVAGEAPRDDMVPADAPAETTDGDEVRTEPSQAERARAPHARPAPRAAARLADLRQADVPLRDHVDFSAVQGILYTSATSGRPKGVMLTYGNHWWSAVGSALNLGLRRDDRWLAPLALYHVGGLAIVWRSVIYGIPIVVHDGFDPDAVNREIDTGAITLASVVATMLERVLDARGRRPFPPCLRCVLLGGGPLPPALLEACLVRGVPVAPTYGLTEAASQVSTLPPEDVARKPGSAGRALLPTEVRIERDGRDAAPEDVGEILVRGPTVMRGYAGRLDDTARALRGGWLHTGDLGHLDASGHLYVVDRRDDLIVSGGENVYPAEVEGVLRAHPAVEEAGVVGVADARWGHLVAALVKVKPGLSISADELRAFCDGRLARYKIPRRVWTAEALPRSAGGKLLRRVLRERAAALLRGEGGSGSS